MLFDNLNEQYNNQISYTEFTAGEDVGIMSSIKVGPTIADDIKQNSVWAIFGSLVIVFFYILLRFQIMKCGLKTKLMHLIQVSLTLKILT